MDKSQKSQILKLSLIASLLIITPLLSTSLRPTYLYLIFNLLIISLGAEAGLLKFFSKVGEDKKAPLVPSEASPCKDKSVISTGEITSNTPDQCNPKRAKVVEKCSSEKIVGAVRVHNKVKKCNSTPSLFFIGGADQSEANHQLSEVDEEVKEEEIVKEEEVEGLSGQELYTKAETFIGNFYNQLKMQREESWKKIHGLYHKAF